MRVILPLLFGIAGVAVLVSLGVWQVQRLDWKESMIARIEARIAAAPVPLPAAPDRSSDEFLPVTLEGRIAGEPLRVLGAWRNGTGYRVVAPVETADGRVLVDLGIVPLRDEAVALPATPIAIEGNLVWPEEVNSSTPEPDGDVWFARDVEAMSESLGTRPVLVVARAVSPAIAPVAAPVGAENIPNNHLGYAIQWFGLALVWAGMTAFFLWRMTRRTA